MRSRAHHPSQLTLSNVSKSYGDRTVLDDVSFTVRPGEKAAVIGENGSGKSTVLRLLARAEQPDSGEVTAVFPGGTGHLTQTLALAPDRTVQDAVDLALAELRTLEADIRAAEAHLADATEAQLIAYGNLLSAYEERDGYRADTRTEAAMHALGLAHVTRDRTLGSLSGGEQSRLALACVLAAAPELLLLDEPTNHLDRAAVDWLAGQLRAHRGTLVVVTHDRVFLERVSTTILEVDRDLRTVVRYGDGWAGYRTARAAARRARELAHQEWAEELARTRGLVEAAGRRLAASGKDPGQGFGKHRRSSEAKLSGQVRAARTRLEQLERAPVAAPPQPLRFQARLATAAPVPEGPLVELTGVKVGARLDVPGLAVKPGQRLLVSGPNGAGKTTLLRVLAGDLTPDTGTVHRTSRHIAYLAQELGHTPTGASPTLNPPPPQIRHPDRTPALTAYAAGRPGLPEEYAEELLALGLFREEDLTVPVAQLSVGQRRRLELARLVARPADLLVLDEPTNHVSLALIEELEEALAHYAGAIVVVSHDDRFQSSFAGDRLELRAGAPVS
ncbi:ABC-F family ATP-binding cassette domain-containing protein [Streptomyces sp. NPDC048361]|uniref:ABC-F family ATP-binding cassette domain-containing protein n=1 Tax=Streptomyces sp. NPDC048361 TaxID=3154720 RepID=UPI003429427B